MVRSAECRLVTLGIGAHVCSLMRQSLYLAAEFIVRQRAMWLKPKNTSKNCTNSKYGILRCSETSDRIHLYHLLVVQISARDEVVLLNLGREPDPFACSVANLFGLACSTTV